MPTPPAAALQAEFLETAPARPAELRNELAHGLLQATPHIAPKFLYDALGSKLFEAITELDEYYPTRTEAAIFEQHREELAQACGTGHTLVDLGAGNCAKAARLFGALRPSRYVAVDISADFLRGALAELQARHPQLPMLGLNLDFTVALELPPESGSASRLMFYPGSSIGNFVPEAATNFLRRVRAAAPGGALLIGVDLVKPAPLLQRAYDDALGVTAAFNLNLLRHVNRLLGSDFDVAQWRHVAFYDAAQARVEMHLEARCDLQVSWPAGQLRRRAGERVHTEDACKYTVEGFDALLRRAGYSSTRCWTDPQGWFAVFVAH
jgi:L-histidine N-alpha-methyltransferase